MTNTTDRITKVYYQSVQDLNDHCIMEEIKNSNDTALKNYDVLIQKLNGELSSLKSANTFTPSEKLIIGKIIEVKTKAISRKAALQKRIDSKKSYKLSNYSDFSSYSSFQSAFKQQPIIRPEPQNQFKVPSLNPPQIHDFKKPQVTERARKSLDLPRPRQSAELSRSHVRSQSPSVRKERPKSVDLSINQAAILAWDQNNQRKTPQRPTSPVNNGYTQRSVSHNGKYQQQTRRKYQYTQPTINTQINLTPVSRTSHSHQSSRSISSPALEKPQLVTSTTSQQTQQGQKPKKLTKYKDKRIIEMMENLQGVDEEACEQILNEIMITDGNLKWDDIAGLESAKRSLKETVVYPFLRPDLFRGLREPISGMLLFGPPGTGKTMIAKTVANESSSTFFSISASSLLSKYLGESEKLIRALFYIAKKLSPSIIFFDEIDSLLTARGDGENESSRRVKTEFLIQWSSLVSANSHNETETPRVLVLAATNLPWAIDEAARRRFSRRLYIPLPEFETRLTQLKKLMQYSPHTLSESDFIMVANLTKGYSGSDITALAKDAAMEPIRDLGEDLVRIQHKEIRGVSLLDFENAMKTIKRSVGDEDLKKFEVWASKFGSSGS